jgi:hypothetical protein
MVEGGSAMIYLKHSVKLRLLQPQLVLALQVADAIWRRHDVLDCVITSANDSQHSAASLHYKGLAADLRSRNIPNVAVKEQILAELREALGGDFDVLLEALDTPNEHFHLEWDPK